MPAPLLAGPWSLIVATQDNCPAGGRPHGITRAGDQGQDNAFVDLHQGVLARGDGLSDLGHPLRDSDLPRASDPPSEATDPGVAP